MCERKKIASFEDLEVYPQLLELHLEISKIYLNSPKHELYELVSQIRRSSNSIPANLAEGWNNTHINICLDGFNRAFGEYQETLHHLQVADRKGYINKETYLGYRERYEGSAKLLRGLESALRGWKARGG